MKYNNLIMTLLHCFRHNICSIYCLVMISLGILPDIKYHRFFFSALLCHSRIVINFYHSCIITICQANTSHTRKDNLENYIALFPWFIIMNIFNCFFGFVIIRNYNELWRRYSRLNKFSHLQVSVHPHEMSRYPSSIFAKNTNVLIVKLLWF